MSDFKILLRLLRDSGVAMADVRNSLSRKPLAP